MEPMMPITPESSRAYRMMIMDHPISGITRPEFQEFAKAIISAIAKATKRLFRSVAGGIVRSWRFVDRKIQEGTEIHNRAQTNIDDRYARNWFYLRSMM